MCNLYTHPWNGRNASHPGMVTTLTFLRQGSHPYTVFVQHQLTGYGCHVQKVVRGIKQVIGDKAGTIRGKLPCGFSEHMPQRITDANTLQHLPIMSSSRRPCSAVRSLRLQEHWCQKGCCNSPLAIKQSLCDPWSFVYFCPSPSYDIHALHNYNVATMLTCDTLLHHFGTCRSQ